MPNINSNSNPSTPARKYSYATRLVCTECAKEYSISEINTFCLDCQAPLFVEYDLDNLKRDFHREEFSGRRMGMWRWHELLPVQSSANSVYLGEGDTPLLALPNLGEELGLSNIFIKDESTNPTGSFKARGISAAISKAKELGIKKVIIPTAGNAGGAMAAYASRVGAEVVLVDGLISEAARMAGIKARAEGWFDLSTFKEPYRVEGKKIMGYELAEAFDWALPDVIVYPTGGGTGLVGMWKAFHELENLGWLDQTRRPRMVAVQAEGCAPVVKAFESKSMHCDFWIQAHTIASGLRVPKSFADRLILRDLYESNGMAVSVRDEAILAAQRQLGEKEGIFSAPEGAATLAGLIKLVQQDWVRPDERIVLFNTGSGLKYIHTAAA
jgi:threonine synthase